MYFIFFALLFAFAAGRGSYDPDGLRWDHLTLANFTAKHNLAVLKAHARDWQHLMQILSKPAVRDISMEETVFTLYTRNGPESGSKVVVGDAGGLTTGHFDSRKPIVFATHGFLSGGSVDWMLQMKTAQLQQLDCNFFTIDWSECADSILYPSAVDCTRTVGGYLAELVQFLGQQGGDIAGMHLMGHSLGAHLVAQVSQHGHKVARITGWDPAGPLFDDDDLPGRIDPSDAGVVDIIHTNCFMFGYNGLLGHYDFFPNGGDDQPGCIVLDYLCDHSMSYYYYIQSLYYPEKYPAVKCNSFDDAKDGKCSGEIDYMGERSVQGKPGIYYIKVNDPATGSPFQHVDGGHY